MNSEDKVFEDIEGSASAAPHTDVTQHNLKPDITAILLDPIRVIITQVPSLSMLPNTHSLRVQHQPCATKGGRFLPTIYGRLYVDDQERFQQG